MGLHPLESYFPSKFCVCHIFLNAIIMVISRVTISIVSRETAHCKGQRLRETTKPCWMEMVALSWHNTSRPQASFRHRVDWYYDFNCDIFIEKSIAENQSWWIKCLAVKYFTRSYFPLVVETGLIWVNMTPFGKNKTLCKQVSWILWRAQCLLTQRHL